MTEEDMGASVPDQALVASDGAASVSTLTGFDPSRIVEVATKLLGAHPRDLGRAMMMDGPGSFYREKNLYPSPAIEAGKPVYMVVKYGPGAWGVQKCRSMFINNNGEQEIMYEWLWPATQYCRSRAEAVEWMRADAEGRSPDFSKFPRRMTCYEAEYFDQFGKRVRDSDRSGEAVETTGSTEGESAGRNGIAQDAGETGRGG